jgi:uncharacterized membrane protein (DUF373 family)
VDIDRSAAFSERLMKWLELGAAYFLVLLFAIGLFDLGLTLFELVRTGEFTDPNRVIDVVDTVLVLLIIVEIYQTAVAFSRNEPVVRIVVNAALIAVARKIISFRPDEYPSPTDAFVNAAAFALLLAVVIAAFYVVRQVDVESMVPETLE